MVVSDGENALVHMGGKNFAIIAPLREYSRATAAKKGEMALKAIALYNFNELNGGISH